MPRNADPSRSRGNWGQISVKSPPPLAINTEAASAHIYWPSGLNDRDEALSNSKKATAAGCADKLLCIIKVRQPSNLTQVLGCGKVAAIRCHQHRARNSQCHGVVQPVEHQSVLINSPVLSIQKLLAPESIELEA